MVRRVSSLASGRELCGNVGVGVNVEDLEMVGVNYMVEEAKEDQGRSRGLSQQEFPTRQPALRMWKKQSEDRPSPLPTPAPDRSRRVTTIPPSELVPQRHTHSSPLSLGTPATAPISRMADRPPKRGSLPAVALHERGGLISGGALSGRSASAPVICLAGYTPKWVSATCDRGGRRDHSALGRRIGQYEPPELCRPLRFLVESWQEERELGH